MSYSLTRREMIGAGAALAVLSPPAFGNAGQIFTVIGTGMAGIAVDSEPAGKARINNPFGVLFGPDGVLYWADFGSDRVLKLKSGFVFVVAGNGEKGHAGDGGPAWAARLSAPHEIRFDSKDNMLIAERDSHVVRIVDARTGIISTLAGIGAPGFGGDGGPSTSAQLRQPHSIALDSGDNVYICDIQNNRVRRRDAATGVLTTFAGNGTAGDTPDGAPLAAPLRGPRSIDIGPDGTIYLILREGNKVYSITPGQSVLRHIAGTGVKGYSGDGGPARDATFNGPKGVVHAGGDLYISDTENHVIRKVSLRDGMISTVVGTGARGDGPDGDPRQCALARPHGLTVKDGLLYIGDTENHRIRALRI